MISGSACPSGCSGHPARLGSSSGSGVGTGDGGLGWEVGGCGCACCCGAFQAHQFGSPMLSSGFSAAVNTQLCEGCGTCRDLCQFSAIEINNKIAIVNREACFGCGVCVDVCENYAISLNLDPDRGIPLEIKKLINEAQLAS